MVAILPVLLLSLAIGSLVFAADYFIADFANIVRLIVGFGLGAFFYLIVAKAVRLTPFVDFNLAINERITNRLTKKRGAPNLKETVGHELED
jgi:hypothetical protein